MLNIDQLIELALSEDLGEGDHTSLATIPQNAIKKARLIAKEDGILAGVAIAEKVFITVNDQIIFTCYKNDGDKIKAGDHIFTVEGNAIAILSAERLALNFLQRMSGIATFTSRVNEQVQGLPVKILDTRKTTPLLRQLEKEAVKLGGGSNHRFGLYDMIMIKDNHIDFAGGIKQAIIASRDYLEKNKKNLTIEIEVRNTQELEEVMEVGGIGRIMLDNFTPDELKKAVERINGQYETEASGGINIKNIRAFAETGVDYISVGALTHQIKSLDLSLKAFQ